MHVLHEVELSVLVAGVVAIFAIFASRLARMLRLPSPVIFLLAGVVVAAISERAHDAATFERIATLGTYALVFILFEGGFSNGGWLRTGPAVRPILVLGLGGTLVTTALLALAAHYLLGLPVEVSVLVAVALAPTDPAAVFSVLGEQDVRGSTDIILEGESGANDPVGISLMLGAIAYYESGGSLAGVAGDFALQLVAGAGIGIIMGVLMTVALRRAFVGGEALHVLATIGGAFLTFGIATQLHGSGFLAVFVAGLLVGRERLEGHEHTHGFLAVLAGLAEMTMFTALGLTASFAGLRDEFVVALLIFAILTFVIRPLVTLLGLLPERVSRGERIFVAWGGLKGAVPILLASFAILGDVSAGHRVYDIVFVAVVASVAIQGSTLPWLARRFGLLAPPRSD
jgi:cell volume regulation protein A